VQYVLNDTPAEALGTPVYEGDGYAYRLPRTAGPVWSVSTVDQVSDPRVLLSRIGSSDFDPETIAYVYEEGLPAEFTRAEVTLVERGLHTIRLRTSAPGEAFVVLSEIHYEPGWVATVSGVEVPIHRVNHLLRGVQVPAGDHEIVFRWRSAAYRTGRVVSRGAGVLWLLLVAIPVVGRFRRR
jgi:hypothetical protein